MKSDPRTGGMGSYANQCLSCVGTHCLSSKPTLTSKTPSEGACVTFRACIESGDKRRGNGIREKTENLNGIVKSHHDFG